MPGWSLYSVENVMGMLLLSDTLSVEGGAEEPRHGNLAPTSFCVTSEPCTL